MQLINKDPNLNIMQNQKLELEQIIRRSSSCLPEKLLQFYLQYARIVKDQAVVYEYMEQNRIGINNPNFWLARLSLLQQQCQYIKVAMLLKQVRANQRIRTHERFYIIESFQRKLIEKIKILYKSKSHGKRSAREYEGFSLSVGYPSKKVQKVGSVEIYVDSPNRMNYQLEDYANAIEDKLPENKQIERMRLDRKNACKELSFISEGRKQLQQISNDLTGKSDSCRRGSYISVKNSDMETPVKRRDSTGKNQNLDSVEIIDKNKIWKTSLSPSFKTPTNNYKSNNKNEQQKSPYEKQLARNNLPIPINPQFSFGRRLPQVNTSFELYQPRNFQNVNDARIQQENESNSRNLASIEFKNGEDSFRLGLVLQECQQEKYETESFSSFDVNSNQQNLQAYTVLGPREDRRRAILVEIVVSPDVDTSMSMGSMGSFGIQDLLQIPRVSIESRQKRISFSQKPDRRQRLSAISQERSYSYSYSEIKPVFDKSS